MHPHRNLANSLLTALALGAAWACAIPPEVAPDKKGCRPYLTVVGRNATFVPPDLRPEVMTAARTVEQFGLDALIAQRRNVRSNEPIRRPHLSLAVPDLKAARLNPSWELEESTWMDLIEQITGYSEIDLMKLVKSFAPTVDVTSGRVLTIRARLPKRSTERPVAALTLGGHHYAVELRTRLEPRTSRLGKKRPSRRVYLSHDSTKRGFTAFGRVKTVGVADANSIPGGIADRGSFRANLIAEVAPDGEVEPLYSIFPPAIHRLSGTWTYEHDWLTLRILLRADQFTLLK